VKLMVVSVVVGLRYTSMSMAVDSRVIIRSGKLMLVFCSRVGGEF
jgi:hypothetical protein